MHLTALLLAAGQSSRMGAANKLLLPLDDRPLVAHVLATLSEAPIEDVVAVTGHEHAAMEAVLKGFPVRWVHNPRYADGMATSIACGVEAAAPGTDGFLICLGDMPFVTPEVVARLRWTFFEAERPALVVPVADGRRGHPVLFDAVYRDELLALTGDVGARAVLQAHAEAIIEVEMESPSIFADVDTQAIYERLLQRPEARS